VWFKDVRAGRSSARVVWHQETQTVYLETEGNHDGVIVHTAVAVDRARFVALMKELGVMS
jgi:hypothetical protein